MLLSLLSKHLMKYSSKVSFLLLEGQGESYMLTNKGITLVKGEPKSLDIILASLKTDFTFHSLSSSRVALYLLPQVTAFPYYC